MPSDRQIINKTALIKSLEELRELAEWLKSELQTPSLILLKGDLGTGKTAFAKKLLNQFGIPENQVKSPTFSLINIFEQEDYKLAHLDLYRLNSHDQFLLEEIREILSSPKTVMLIEWPEKLNLNSVFPLLSQLIIIDIKFDQNNFRIFQICVKKSAEKQQK